jgi:hypothetical protein
MAKKATSGWCTIQPGAAVAAGWVSEAAVDILSPFHFRK